MAKTFDATTRSYLEKHPADWSSACGLAAGAAVRVVNSDLSTITTEADKVLLVEALERWLIHFELQTRYDPRLPLRVLRYNVLLSYRHKLPVHSVVVLLCREADGAELTGVLHQVSPDGRCRLEFHYQVVRVWELEVARLLAGGIGTLPLAPLAARSEEEMPAIVERLMQRVDPSDTSADAREFWTTVAFLAGLRYKWESIKHWFQGVTAMRESSVYQGLLQEGRAEGRAEEARRILLLQGERRFGPADAATRATLDAMADLEQLERWLERLLNASSWAELLVET